MEKLTVFMVVLAVVGCGVPQDEDHAADEMTLSSRSSQIINGHVTTGFPSVGMTNGCSSTLIGRRTVITAAHCVSHNGQTGTFCSNNFCVNVTYYKHPNYTGSPDYFNDIAILRLESDFQALSGIIPTRIASSAPREGASIWIVGFGCTNWDTRAGYGTRPDAFSGVGDFVRRPRESEEHFGKAPPFGRGAVFFEGCGGQGRREGRRALM